MRGNTPGDEVELNPNADRPELRLHLSLHLGEHVGNARVEPECGAHFTEPGLREPRNGPSSAALIISYM
jgi:hypothetical protein